MVESVPAPHGRLSAGARIYRALADPPRLAVLAAAFAILLVRRPDAWSRPQFWAEDGFFYLQARTLGLKAFLFPYSGYLHAVPRAIAALAAACDPAWAPAAYVACAALFTLTVAAMALSRRCPLPKAAGLSALAVVLVPDAREVLLNAVNLQWVLGAGLVLLLLSEDPRTPFQRASDGAAAVAFGLSGPFCVVLAPLFAWRGWRRRTSASLAIAAAVVACALLQGHFILTTPSAEPVEEGHGPDAAWALPAIGQRVGGSLILGVLLPAATPRAATAALGLATLAGAAYLALARGPASRERLLLGAAFALFLASALYRSRHALYQYSVPLTVSRYVYLPQLLALWLLLAAASGTGRLARVATGFAVFALLANLPRLKEPPLTDMHWERYVPLIRDGEEVTVPINPGGWTFTLPARGD